MDFHLGCDVRGRDDEGLGSLRRIVIDPETLEVLALVVQHSGFDGREVLVPIGAVDTSDHGGVVLQLSSDQFSGMDDFAATRNVAPPPVADNLEAEDAIAPENIPDVPAVGAASGVESIAFTPVIEENTHVPGNGEVIDRQARIWATDGEVGGLSDVTIDDQTRRVTAFATEEGFIFKHELGVPIAWVSSIQPGSIILNVEKSAVQENRDE